jgi:hypothetical protein
MKTLNQTYPSRNNGRVSSNVRAGPQKSSVVSHSTSDNLKNVDVDRIVDVILTDEKLFQYIMKLVKVHLRPRDLQDPIFLRAIVDATIETAIEKVQILDIIRNLITEQRRELQQQQQQPQRSTNGNRSPTEKSQPKKQVSKQPEAKTTEYSNGQYSHQLFLDIGDKNVNNPNSSSGDRSGSNISDLEAPVVPQFSEKEPEQVSHQSVKRTLKNMKKNDKPPLGHHQPHPTQHQQNNSNNKKQMDLGATQIITQPLSIATDWMKGNDFSVGESDFNSFISGGGMLDSPRDSEASTIQITLPLDKSVTAERAFPHNNNNYHHNPTEDHHHDDHPVSVFSDSFEINHSNIVPSSDNSHASSSNSDQEEEAAILNRRRQNQQRITNNKKKNTPTTTANKNNDDNLFINQSFQVTSEFNSVQNSLEALPHRKQQQPPQREVSETISIPEEKEETAHKGMTKMMPRTVSEDFVDNDETVKDWERRILADLKKSNLEQSEEEDEEYNHQLQQNHNQNQSKDFSEHSAGGSSDRPKLNESSHHYEDDRFEDSSRGSHDSSSAGGAHHSNDNYLHHSKYSSAHYPKHHSPQTSPSHHQQQQEQQQQQQQQANNSDYLASDYDPLQNKDHLVVFDQEKWEREVDAALQEGRPQEEHNKQQQQKLQKSRVKFLDGVIKDVHYYERANPDEARDMYYSHEDLDRFDMHYRKEDALAEKMGLTWMDWKNRQPDDEELSFSEDEDDHNNNNRGGGEQDYRVEDDEDAFYSDDYDDYHEREREREREEQEQEIREEYDDEDDFNDDERQ